ncbi:ECF-type sigma factor [Acanthopleuribacter pedis]|uniref:RNA polymerase sigma-70 ECF-like HTH domain-containing protein n=1 Tax=Acanthopleuribacter pedis TaxID=442870 RepID=A0A8J7U7E4_9BACT|nr:ECF-type sigma factor [Acanthopleuribacter pedis]MBO1322423.1 hypothetical protein [Acanthopleuribacter pedis]
MASADDPAARRSPPAQSQSEPHDLDEWFVLVYNDLRCSARFYLQQRGADLSLQPTALVHEVYEILHGETGLVFESRLHFFRCARLMMRRFIVHYARRKLAQKRGGGLTHHTLDESRRLGSAAWSPEQLLCLADALETLRACDPRRCRIAELRFYLGLTHDEIALVLGCSARSVRREWQTAQLWLARELRGVAAPAVGRLA